MNDGKTGGRMVAATKFWIPLGQIYFSTTAFL